MVWFDLQWYHVRKLGPRSDIVSQRLMDRLAAMRQLNWLGHKSRAVGKYKVKTVAGVPGFPYWSLLCTEQPARPQPCPFVTQWLGKLRLTDTQHDILGVFPELHTLQEIP
jgi:hypothetical protein